MGLNKIILLSFLLSGCATTLQNKTDAIVADKFSNSVVYPDLSPCNGLPPARGKSFGDIYEYTTVTLANAYDDCSNKQKVLADFINEVYKK